MIRTLKNNEILKAGDYYTFTYPSGIFIPCVYVRDSIGKEVHTLRRKAEAAGFTDIVFCRPYILTKKGNKI